MAIATFGAGCFWGPETAFSKVEGVTATSVGYAGGTRANPTYEQVCGGATGHTEVVRVEFDPDRIAYRELLDLFWEMHDPTQLNRQGPDVGSQYRTAIYCEDEEQEDAARASKAALEESGRVGGPVVTEIAPAGDFWPAEDYHQQYFEKQATRAQKHRW